MSKKAILPTASRTTTDGIQASTPSNGTPRVPQDLNSGASPAQIAQLAYAYWSERGCPQGSPDEDWLRAEAYLSGGSAGTQTIE